MQGFWCGKLSFIQLFTHQTHHESCEMTLEGNRCYFYDDTSLIAYARITKRMLNNEEKRSPVLYWQVEARQRVETGGGGEEERRDVREIPPL